MTRSTIEPKCDPKIIVYTRAFNAEKTIRRAVESILNQTYSDFEYYLIDNGSTDQTRAIMEEYAKSDARVSAMSIEAMNNIGTFKEILPKKYPDNYYLCYLDADDEYMLDFLEKTFAFAQANDLDIAVAGSDYIDADSGHVVERKTINKELIIQGRAFADEFMQYRGLIGAFWGKLFKYTTFKGISLDKLPTIRFCNDSIHLWTYFKRVKRFGFLPQSLYKYYLYPNSLSRYFNCDRLNDCHVFFRQYKKSLERFGPISPLNMDYLYAIWLGWMDDFIFKPLCDIDLPIEKKLSLLSDVFASAVTKAMLRHVADPRFHNLAAREDFLQRVCAWVYAQEESKTTQGRVLVAKMLKNMDTRPKGSL